MRPEPGLSADALRQLRRLAVRHQRLLVDAIRLHLVVEDPTIETRKKFRLRRASTYADYELRVGDWRVFYRVGDRQEVTVALLGRKRRNALIVEGKEFKL